MPNSAGSSTMLSKMAVTKRKSRSKSGSNNNSNSSVKSEYKRRRRPNRNTMSFRTAIAYIHAPQSRMPSPKTFARNLASLKNLNQYKFYQALRKAGWSHVFALAAAKGSR